MNKITIWKENTLFCMYSYIFKIKETVTWEITTDWRGNIDYFIIPVYKGLDYTDYKAYPLIIITDIKRDFIR